MIEEKKKKEISLFIQEKKVYLRKLQKAVDVYAGSMVRVSEIAGLNRQTIQHYAGDKNYLNETPVNIENYNKIISCYKQALKEFQREALNKSQEIND